MGMGAIPCNGWVISKEEVEKICPTEMKLLMLSLSKEGMTLDCLGRDVQDQNIVPDSVDNALGLLCEQFKENTQVQNKGLELELHYYDSESGDIYDDLDEGAYFLVYGMQELSPAGKKFSNVVEPKSWTVRG